jgi:heparinase II/III-like protein
VTRHHVARIARMDRAEIAWRGKTAARAMFDRVRVRFAPPQWNRDDLLRALAPSPALAVARGALADRRWDAAERELARHFARAPQRFVISPAIKTTLIQRLRAEFPGGAHHAAARADRIVAGCYDLLGYRGLRLHTLDWHVDPILNRRPPLVFWADVPYLDPACGDHKVIWELNRHQHWIALGRAYWLTGDARYRRRCLEELASWIDTNPPLVGVNWASALELSVRSISWLWAINFFVDDEGPAQADEAPWLVDLLVALDRQLTHVERNVSYYFSPNTHLLGEALALYVSGRALPELAASPRRAALGRRILLAEIDRQVAADGGHAERSTHYHRYTLDFYSLALIVARLTGDDARDRFEEVVARLGFAARLLADDRGRIPRFGDDDGGALLLMTGRATDDLRDSLAIAASLTGRPDLQIGRAPEEAAWMLSGLSVQSSVPNLQSPPSGALPETGYYISRSAAADHLVIDGGPHGYQNGGHAHADALSLTFSVRGLPLLIDPGTACYTTDPALRDRMRSTSLHNTVTLDGRPQSVPRGPFHWTHVANARVAAWRANDAFDYFDGTHDGYAPVEHRRRVLALHGDLMVVADLVNGDGTHAAAVHWHLDPRWIVDVGGRHVAFTRAGERIGLMVPQGLVEAFVGDTDTGLGWYSPEYGTLHRTTTIRVSHSGAAPFWLVSVFDLDPLNPVADVDWMPVWAEAGSNAHATAVRITRAASVDYVAFAEPARDHEDRATAPAERPASSACPAPSAVKRGSTLRVGEFETDARMLFGRVSADRPVARLAIVDGSLVRTPGRRGFLLALPRTVPDLHLDFTADARFAGPAFGARLVVGGRERSIELERRAAPR